MTNEEIAAELERLNEKATPGPWAVEPIRGYTTDYIVTLHPDYAPDRVRRHRNYVGETGLGSGQTEQRFSQDAALIAFYRTHHAAIVSALRGNVPAGFVIVPREPTNKMLQAHPIASDLLPVEVVMKRRRKIWAAMLTAAQEQPASLEPKP